LNSSCKFGLLQANLTLACSAAPRPFQLCTFKEEENGEFRVEFVRFV